MQIRIFNVPLSDPGDMQAELNRFLATHKVLEIEQHFYQNDNGGFWSFCVRYIQGPSPSGGGSTPSGGRTKVDYKQILNENEFSIFSRLREIRKQLANEDGVPAYAVFTDEELSGIARLSEVSERNLTSISGIGEKKVARYGGKVVQMLNTQIAQEVVS